MTMKPARVSSASIVEPPTREGAIDAGWRFAQLHPGDVLVLRHSGLLAGRWRLSSVHDRTGYAVEAFKRVRAVIKHGALAVWHAGTVPRFELVTVEEELRR